MKTRIPLVGGFFTVLAVSGLAEAVTLFDNDDPRDGYGVTVLSDLLPGHQVGDPFTLTHTATLQKVEWWGEQGSASFSIRVFPFGGAVPGASPLLNHPVEVTGTTVVVSGDEYLHYLAELPETVLAPGSYLLSIVDRDVTQAWFWAASCEDGCESDSWRRGADGGTWTPGNFRFAYRLYGTPDFAPGTQDVCYATTGLADGGRLLAIDLGTGAGTLVSDLPAVDEMPGLALDDLGRLHGAGRVGGQNCLSLLDPVTGDVGSVPLRSHEAVAFTPDGELCGVDDTDLRLIDPVCGTTQDLGSLALPDPATGMAFDPTDGTLWMCTATALFTVDLATNAVSPVGPEDGSLDLTDLVFDRGGLLYAVTDAAGPDVLLSLNKVTGAASPIGVTGYDGIVGLASWTSPATTGITSPAPRRALATTAFPNPFRPRTEIAFELPRPDRATIEIFDVSGRLVKTLLDGELPAGAHAVAWDATDRRGRRVVAGTYLYRVTTPEGAGAGRIVHVR